MSSGPHLIVISAPSGTGKSTILARVLERVEGIRFAVSHATRPPRRGESDGVDYHFVSRDEFEALIERDAFLEWADVHGDLKGTSKAEVDRARADGTDLLLDLDVQGASLVKKQMPDCVQVFILPPSFAELERRLRGRAQDPEQAIRRRLARAEAEMRHLESYDYAVVNDDMERAVDTVVGIIRAARARLRCVEPRTREILKSFTDFGSSKE